MMIAAPMKKDIERALRDAILHPGVRQFLKCQALREMRKSSLTTSDRILMERCISEAEYHEVLERGTAVGKRKFFRLVAEKYGWDEARKRERKKKEGA